jgi:hypothetical protein
MIKINKMHKNMNKTLEGKMNFIGKNCYFYCDLV